MVRVGLRWSISFPLPLFSVSLILYDLLHGSWGAGKPSMYSCHACDMSQLIFKVRSAKITFFRWTSQQLAGSLPDFAIYQISCATDTLEHTLPLVRFVYQYGDTTPGAIYCKDQCMYIADLNVIQVTVLIQFVSALLAFLRTCTCMMCTLNTC